MADINWVKDKVNNEYRPTLYPGEDTKDWNIPEAISSDYHRLNAIIENKYSREFLKICAFYNKMFSSLKTSEWNQSSYNTPPFTAMEQEHSDTGYGTNYNFLKEIVDQLTSRLGTISFTPKLMSEEQSFEYIVYKDEVERVLRKLIRNDDLQSMCIEAFHNAAVVCYSHAFIDPYTGSMVKANDYEIGMFESQFNHKKIKQMLYRDYSFPVTEVFHYIKDMDEKAQAEFLESLTGRSAVDFTMYFDCVKHEVYVTINGKTLPAAKYPFDYVLVTTFKWDTTFARQLSSSVFDLLYPIQREVNKMAAKQQVMVRNYKGPVPLFNSDADLILKQISNGTGEALFIDSSRSATELMTVINPTPLDPQIDAEIQSRKVTMYELVGIQSASFDMENMRSAAAVVALDQTRDSVFQAQMSGMSQYIKSLLKLYIDYLAEYPDKSGDRRQIDWKVVSKLMSQCYVNMQPVHLNDPLSDEQKSDDEQFDYIKLATSRILLDVINGEVTFDSLPYYIEPSEIVVAVAVILIKFEALGIDVPSTVHAFLMAAYVDAVKNGEAVL